MSKDKDKVTVDVEKRVVNVPGLLGGLKFEQINTESLHEVVIAIEAAYATGLERGAIRVARAADDARCAVQRGDAS